MTIHKQRKSHSNVTELVELDVARAADRIGKAWRAGIESIIRCGQLLLDYRERWIAEERGKWSRLVGANQWQGKGLLPFSKSHAHRLMSIAGDARLVPHAVLLPSDMTTLAMLTRLEDLDEYVASRKVHPAMRRLDARALLDAESAAYDEEPIVVHGEQTVELVHSPCLDLLKRPAASVDLIATDPPYEEASLGVYDDLGKVAAHVLKPGGVLLCMTGVMYLPEVLAALGKHLDYHWIDAMLIVQGSHSRVHARKVISEYKPVVRFAKEGYSPSGYVTDVIRSLAADKRIHPWQQPVDAFHDLLGRYVRPGQDVLDLS
jgi:hypothetical protein